MKSNNSSQGVDVVFSIQGTFLIKANFTTQSLVSYMEA